MTKILCERFFSDDNCDLKFKFVILNDKAVNEIRVIILKIKNLKLIIFMFTF